MLTGSVPALFLGFLLDLMLGDPEGCWHPVRGIGWLITHCEKILRRIFPRTPKGERRAGVLLVILVLTASLGFFGAVLAAAYRLSPLAGFAVETLFCYQLLAVRSLRDESTRVRTALEESLPAGRKALARIVGRDTETLDEAGVLRAAVETIAENFCDGVIAPLFYMAIGGVFLGFFCKTVNTLDSMVGYRTDRYRSFGWAAARLDDLCQFIPARLSAELLIAASFLPGYHRRDARAVYRRDRALYESPNAACTEAAMAGALGIELGGDARYFGVPVKKATLGEAKRPIEREDIGRANRLMIAGAVGGWILALLFRFLLTAVF